MKYVIAAAELVFGAALLAFGGFNVMTEMARHEPSTIRLALFVGIGLLGGLVMPSIGGALRGAAKDGITLGQLGRRAYDGKAVELEPKDGAK